MAFSNYIFERKDDLIKVYKHYIKLQAANLTLQTSAMLHCYENNWTFVTPMKNIVKLLACLLLDSYF